jgi:hypothetical protein
LPLLRTADNAQQWCRGWVPTGVAVGQASVMITDCLLQCSCGTRPK